MFRTPIPLKSDFRGVNLLRRTTDVHDIVNYVIMSTYSRLFFIFLITELQEEHHETVLPVLLTCFHFQPGNAGVIGSCPRVTHRALLALAQMVEACPEGAVAPHADVMIQRYESSVARTHRVFFYVGVGQKCVLLIRYG